MNWIDNLVPGYGTVTGQYVAISYDSSDADLTPDVQPLNGTITLTPTVTAGRIDTALAQILAVQVRVFGGQIVDDEDQPGVRIMSNDTDLGVQDWAWTAHFSFESGLKLKPLPFKVAAGETVNLTSGIVPVESAPYQIVQGLSAYEVAVSQGFIGSADDWIESLRGPKGADGTTEDWAPAIAAATWARPGVPTGAAIDQLGPGSHQVNSWATANSLTHPSGKLPVLSAGVIEVLPAFATRVVRWTSTGSIGREVWQTELDAGAWTPWHRLDVGGTRLVTGREIASLSTGNYYIQSAGDAAGITLNGQPLPVAVSGWVEVFNSPAARLVRYSARSGAQVWQTERDLSTWTTWTRIDGAASSGSTTVTARTAKREVHVREATERRGGVIGTGGRPAVALRFDHYLVKFRDAILPLLRERGLPWTLVVNPENVGTGQDAVSWSELQSMCLTGGGEVFNHGGNHRDATGDAAIRTQIVTSKEALQANLPSLAIEGWAFPGISATAYDGAGYFETPSNWDTYAGQLIYEHHAFAGGGGPAKYTQLDGRVKVGMAHMSADTMTSNSVTSWLNALRPGTGLCAMIHPLYLDTSGYVTTQVFTQFLDELVARRDAGTLEVLTLSGLFLADASTTLRDDLLTVHTATGTFSQSIALWDWPQYKGGMRQLSAVVTMSGAGTVVTKIGDDTRSHTLAQGTHRVYHPAPLPLNLGGQLTVSITGAASVSDAHLYAV